jgi:hypothetical protein
MYTPEELEMNRLVTKISLDEELTDAESRRLDELFKDREWTGYEMARMREDGTIDVTTMHYLDGDRNDFGSYPFKTDDPDYEEVKKRHKLVEPGDQNRINQRYRDGKWIDVDE